MTLAEVLGLARATRQDEPHHNRILFGSDCTKTADDLLHDTALELRSVPFDDDVPTIPGKRQLCLFETLIDVLDAWSEWRDGRKPTLEQAAKALAWYLQNDAFIPPDQD